MMRSTIPFALAVMLSALTGSAYAMPRDSGAGGSTPLETLPIIAARFVKYCPNEIVQSFPVSGPAQTTWRICWHEVRGEDSLHNPNGLVIGPVDFKTTPKGPWRRVVYDMRISDFFVPYHAGEPRYYDLSDTSFEFKLQDIPADGCPAAAGATLVDPHVCKEVHDRGLLWLDATGAMRGAELVLWGVIDAENYKYIERYTFRDDGVILGEEGATGQNLPGFESETHVHNALWRIDIDVFGTVNDAAHVQHVEKLTQKSAIDLMPVISKATGVQWNARTHDAIRVTNTAYKNKRNHNPGYTLMPSLLGGG